MNRGFRGAYIPSSQVNDMVCDCCDGSDEWERPHLCHDTCQQAGAEWREAEKARIAALEAGARAKRELVEQGQAAATDRAGKLSEAQAAREAAEAKVQEAQAAVDQARAHVAAEQAEQAAQQESAVAAALGFADWGPEALRSLLVKLAAAIDGGEEELAKLAAKGPDGHDDASSPGEWPDSAGDAASSSSSNPAVLDAEAALRAAEAAARDARTSVNSLETAAGRDYGPSQEFFGLDGQCISMHTAQYKYEVCPYGSAKQDHTSLGTFSGFEDNYKTMKFTGGTHCWNGPSRSITLSLECGAENELKNVDEPSRCSYAATLITPAACDELHAQPVPDQLEPEL